MPPMATDARSFSPLAPWYNKYRRKIASNSQDPKLETKKELFSNLI